MLLSASGQSMVNDGFRDLHYFFASKNPFYAKKISGSIVVSPNPNHNSFYQSSPQNTTVTEVETSGLFYARTSFVSESENFHNINFPNNKNEQNPKVAKNYLKIITDITGHNLLKDSKEIYWDDNWYDVSSTPTKHGLLQNNFYNYYLEEVK